MSTAEVMDAGMATAVALSVVGSTAAAFAGRRRPARRHDAETVAETNERERLARVRELYAAGKLTTEELERATLRVLEGLEPFPPVETTRPRSVLEAHGNSLAAVLRTANPRLDDAARIAADREARRAARERERWRH